MIYDNAIPEQKKIVIIGGGLAGLSCAYRLINVHGVTSSDIIVLEAHQDLGGRVKQLDGFLPNSHRVELGAELLHGDKTELINLILENASLAKRENTSKPEQFSTANVVSAKIEERTTTRDDLLLESFAWAQGDGGPSDHEINGGYGLYYLGTEKKLLKYNELDPEIEYAHQCLRSIPDVNVKEQIRLKQQRKDILRRRILLGKGKASEEPISNAQFSFNRAKKDTTTFVGNDQIVGDVVTLREYLQNCNVSPRVMTLMDAGYANTLGGTIDCIPIHGAKHLEIGWDKESEEGDFRLLHPRSLRHVIDILTRGVQYITNCVVQSINYSDNLSCVEVLCSDNRTYHAQYVVCALPLQVLKDKDINFYPSLPSPYLKAIDNVGSSRAIKLFLKFSALLLPERVKGMICADSFFPEMWFKSFVKHNIFLVTLFATNSSAEKIASLPQNVVIQKALSQLDEICSIHDTKGSKQDHHISSLKKASNSYVGYYFQDWGKDPFIKMGYSHYSINMNEEDLSTMQIPITGYCKAEEQELAKLWFAGEWMNADAGLTMQAAMVTGYNAADGIIKTMMARSQSLRHPPILRSKL